MEEIFLAIQKAIAEGMPELSLVDEDYGQLDTLPRGSGNAVKKFTSFPRLRERREKIHSLPRGSGSIVKKFTAFPEVRGTS
jgi:hypothetical protein